MPGAARDSNARRRLGLLSAGPVILACLFLSLTLLAAALAPFALAAPVAANPPKSAGLFGRPRIVPNLNPGFVPDPFSSRHYVGTVDLELVKPAGPARLTLNLFEGTELVAVRDHVVEVSPISWTWFGKVEGDDLSSVVLAVTNNHLAGTVRTTSHGTFAVYPATAHVHVISEINQTAFPKDGEPRKPVPASVEPPSKAKRGLEPVDIAAMEAQFGRRPRLAPRAVTYPAGVPIVDVMVVYTANARLAVGGTANMLAMINLGVDETNQAYINSGINMRIRLVYTYETSYVETSMNADLDAISNPSDGKMDEVHTIRDWIGADLVSLWTTQSEYCGLGWMATSATDDFSAWAFSTVSYSCATGYFSFGHEMGHNLGANHDRKNSDGQGVFPYAYGYQDPAGKFRTIMAYNCPYGCPRLQYFSNPNLNYQGSPLGVQSQKTATSADNALTFNQRAETVASFRPRVVPLVGAATTTQRPLPPPTATQTRANAPTGMNVFPKTRTRTTTTATTKAAANNCQAGTRGVPAALTSPFTDIILVPSGNLPWSCSITGSKLPCARNGRVVLNRNNVVRPMEVGNHRYTRGFGVANTSTLSVDLKKQCGNLRVSYGVDHASDSGASVVFSVIADGKTIFTSQATKALEPARLLSLSLVGVSKLTLTTSKTGSGTAYGQWIEPILACGPNSNSLPTITLTPNGGRTDVAYFAEPGTNVGFTATAKDINGNVIPATSFKWQLSRVECTDLSCRPPMLVADAFGRSASSFKLPSIPNKVCGWYLVQVQVTDSCGRRNVAVDSIEVPSRKAVCS